MQYLGHWRQAIGGAGRIAQEVIFSGHQMVIDAQYKCGDAFFRGSGKQDFPSSGFEVFAHSFLVTENSCAFQDHIDVHGSPWELRRIFDRRYMDALAIDQQRISLYGYLSVKTAMGRIVLEQMCQGLGICQVVDGHYLDTLSVEQLSEGEAPYPTESIDRYLFHLFY
jgi:hypothetical protein